MWRFDFGHRPAGTTKSFRYEEMGIRVFGGAVASVAERLRRSGGGRGVAASNVAIRLRASPSRNDEVVPLR
jgi:hypothetical protein